MNHIFKKRIDDMGRVEIPGEIRKVLRLSVGECNMNNGDLLEIWLNERGNMEIKRVNRFKHGARFNKRGVRC